VGEPDHRRFGLVALHTIFQLFGDFIGNGKCMGVSAQLVSFRSVLLALSMLALR
jgi:hypothetical protein